MNWNKLEELTTLLAEQRKEVNRFIADDKADCVIRGAVGGVVGDSTTVLLFDSEDELLAHGGKPAPHGRDYDCVRLYMNGVEVLTLTEKESKNA